MRQLKFREWRGKKFHCFGFIDGGFNGPVNISSIVEQFTGLKDKNGVELYEGDRVKNIIGDTGVVYYDTSHAAFMFKYKHWDEPMFMDAADLDFEVIGNIHTETLNKGISKIITAWRNGRRYV